MTNTTRNIIAVSVAVILFAIGIIYSIISGRSGTLPDDVIGNTAGNLNNDGMFAECDGMIYFSNPYDHGALYKMSSDGTDFKKLNDLSVKFINAGSDYVFFYGEANEKTSGLGGLVAKPAMYMISNNGKKSKTLTKDVSQDMLLVGNSIYYQHYTTKTGTTFAKIDLKTKDSSELLDYMINPSCYYNGKFYYNGMYDDHYLYSYDTTTGDIATVWEGDLWNPIYDGSFVYYMDVLNNYRLCRYSISNNTIEILTKDRVDSYNLYGNVIYYQKNSQTEPQLKRMLCDGSSNEVVAEGNFSGISITSNYVFFTPFGSQGVLYYTSTYGSINVREFTPAREAANTAK